MAVQWRAGFRRVATATAVVYWLVALICVAIYVWPTLRPSQQSFFLNGPNGRGYEVHAYTSDVANDAIKAAAKAEPGPGDPAVPYETIETQQPQPWRLNAAWQAFLEAVGWALGVYLALVLISRGVRWIARGFLDGGAKEAA